MSSSISSVISDHQSNLSRGVFVTIGVLLILSTAYDALSRASKSKFFVYEMTKYAQLDYFQLTPIPSWSVSPSLKTRNPFSETEKVASVRISNTWGDWDRPHICSCFSGIQSGTELCSRNAILTKVSSSWTAYLHSWRKFLFLSSTLILLWVECSWLWVSYMFLISKKKFKLIRTYIVLSSFEFSEDSSPLWGSAWGDTWDSARCLEQQS